jgi:2-keto-3-deoxy-6-phosphogluconate aldolase
MFKEDMINSIEFGVICGINAIWINEWLNVGVACASLGYMGYKTYLLHKNKDKK